MMARLLVIHHTTSPHLQAMFEAVMSGATDQAIEGVTVVARPALAATAIDVLEADGYLLGTPANIGYMSGALKHFFDQIYYPCLDATLRRPYGLYVHGSSDTTGAGPGGGGDRPGSWMAPRAGSSERARRPEPGGPGGLLGAWRRDGGRLEPTWRLTLHDGVHGIRTARAVRGCGRSARRVKTPAHASPGTRRC
jgi:hypothetical protein